MDRFGDLLRMCATGEIGIGQDYCITVAPGICAACTHWHSNDGDGLDAAGALALADALENEISAKRTQDFERRERSAWEMAFPMEPCDICAGAGVEMPGPQRGASDRRERGIECEWCGGPATFARGELIPLLSRPRMSAGLDNYDAFLSGRLNLRGERAR
ncbi:hypothetical protein [Bradyrhizobium sp. I1.7.5]|uniref:hypothetical protein n=1 Tax=Bradyrhizobium sp. I1.7.5 TaxID=3156363 RepID=UPI0033912615